MSEQTIAGAVGQIAAPVVAALLEDLHAAASAEITRLEASTPARITAAETDVRDWATDLLGTIHTLAARINNARANITAATVPGPTAAETATSTSASAPTTAPATTATPQGATTNPAASK